MEIVYWIVLLIIKIMVVIAALANMALCVAIVIHVLRVRAQNKSFKKILKHNQELEKRFSRPSEKPKPPTDYI